jgi:hypothetical protein
MGRAVLGIRRRRSAVVAVLVLTFSLMMLLGSLAHAEEVTGSITPTEAGTSRTISLPAPGDHAVVSVPVSAGESVSMVSSEAALSAGYRLDWLNPKGEYLHTWFPAGDSDRFFEPIKFEEAGTATLLIHPEEAGTGSITFTVYDASDRTSSISVAGGGETKTLTVAAPGQRSLVHFEGAAGQHVSLIPSAADFEGEFHVNTPAGEWLEGSGGTLEGIHGPLTLPEAGTYTLVLTGDGAQTGRSRLCARPEGEPATPPACSLLVALGLNETEGKVAHDATGFIEASVDGPQWVTGKFGGALGFDSEEEDSLLISPSPDADASSYTFEAWVFPEGEEPSGAVFSQQDKDGYGLVLDVDGGPGGTPEVRVSDGANIISVDAENPLPIDAWTHLSATCDGKELLLFADDEEVGSAKGPCLSPTGAPITVGASRADSFEGRIDEIRVYESALTAAELADDGESPIEGTRPSLMPEPAAAYSFEEGRGAIASDIIGTKDASLSSPEWIEGADNGGALLFSGARKDLMEVPAIGRLDMGNSFTVEAWIQPRFPEGTSPVITSQAPDGSGFSLEVVPRNDIGFGVWALKGSVRSAAGESTIVGEELFGSYQWQQVALTYDGESLRIFVDGNLIGSAPAPELGTLESALLVGGDPEANGYFTGGIDDVRVYRQPLSATQLLETLEIPLENPRIVLEGKLWEAGPEELVGPAAPLSLSLSDVKGKIRTVEFLLDGQRFKTLTRRGILEASGEEFCAEDWCSIGLQLSNFLPSTITPGPHELEVIATDESGTHRRRSRGIDIDKDAPTLEITGSLVEADGAPLVGEKGIIEVSAADDAEGLQSGLERIDIAVDGTHVESSYVGEESEGRITYEYRNEEWGAGPHEVSVIGIDYAGNESIRSVKVNSSPVSIKPSCDSPEPEMKSAGEAVDAEEAEAAIEAAIPAALAPNEDITDISPAFVASESPEAGPDFSIKGGLLGGRALSGKSGGTTIGQAACLRPTETTEQAGSPILISGASAVLYPNAGHDLDTLVRATSLGSDLIESFRGPSSARTLTWKVVTKQGQSLISLENGGVAISGQEGQPVVTNAEPEPMATAGNPELVNSVSHQTTAALSDVATAEVEIGETADAVIPVATAISQTGKAIDVEVNAHPSEGTVSIDVPEGTVAVLVRLESSPDSAAMCAQAFEGNEGLYEDGCGPVAEAEEPGTIAEDVDWAPSGKLYFLRRSIVERKPLPAGGYSEQIVEPTIVRSNADGSQIEEAISPEYVEPLQVDVSPSGQFLTFEACEAEPGGSCGIFVEDLASHATEMTLPLPGPILTVDPTFSPSGNKIYFYKNEPTSPGSEEYERQIWSMHLDGSSKKRVTALKNSPSCGSGESCNVGIEDARISVGGSPEKLVFRDGGNLWEVAASRENATRNEMVQLTTTGGFLASEFNQSGSKIAYSRMSVGGSEPGVYTMASDGSKKEFVTPTAGSIEAVPSSLAFSPNDGEVAFSSARAIYKVGSDGGEYAEFVSDGEDATPFSHIVGELTPEQGPEEEEVEAEVKRIELIDPQVPGYPSGHLHAGETNFCLHDGFLGILPDKTQAEECNAFDQDNAYAQHAKYYLYKYKGADDNTIANAFLHSFWTAMMVRDSKKYTGGKPDGLIYARLHEGPGPHFSKESEMDFINDRVGTNYWLFHGEDGQEDEKGKLELCTAFLTKSENAIYLDPSKIRRPGTWARSTSYRFRRLVYYLKYSRRGKEGGEFVRPSGLSCAEAIAEPEVGGSGSSGSPLP